MRHLAAKRIRPRESVLALARVLLVDGNPASRLILQTVLTASGYDVDTAASAAEAVLKLDEREYELVLSDLQMESPDAGLKVIAHARLAPYKPATALITAYHNSSQFDTRGPLLIEPENLPELLGKVAALISERATRRVARQLRYSDCGLGSRRTAFSN